MLNLLEIIFKKTPTVDIVHNGEGLIAFLLSLGTRKKCLLSPLLFKMVLEVPAAAIKQGKKGTQIVKEEIKWSLFADNMKIQGSYKKEQTDSKK